MDSIVRKLNTKFILLLLLFIGYNLNLSSQVTIGLSEEANKGALLQLKNKEMVTGGEENANKGLLLPRVNLSRKYELFPMFLKVPADTASGRTTDYEDNKPDYDLMHTGLMVYNMEEDYEKDLCLGVNTWDGEKWNCARYPTYDYEMDCSTVKVGGLYYKNAELDGSHKITLRIKADEKMVGKTYYIKTDEIDGIRFFAQGKITANAATAQGQEVEMKGKGKSTNREIKRFTLTANNTSGQTCSATVVVVIPTKKVLVLANSYDYGYNISKSGTGSYGIFTTSNNFGVTEESTIKYQGTRFMNYETPYERYYDADCSSTELKNLEYGLLNAPIGEKIDIVVLSQDVYLVDLLKNDELARILAEFVNRKGVLVALYEGNGDFQETPSGVGTGRRGSVTALLQKIWGQTANDFGYSAKINLGSGAVYPLTDVDDEILNGPFGDVRNKYWGEDASWARGVKNIPLKDIIVYSYGNTVVGSDASLADMITGFRHKTKNFIYFGDGGFTSSTISGDNPTSTYDTMHPVYWKNEGSKKYIPIAKSNYGKHSTKYPVYNSVIYANIMAWAVYQAEVNGINPPQD